MKKDFPQYHYRDHSTMEITETLILNEDYDHFSLLIQIYLGVIWTAVRFMLAQAKCPRCKFAPISQSFVKIWSNLTIILSIPNYWNFSKNDVHNNLGKNNRSFPEWDVSFKSLHLGEGVMYTDLYRDTYTKALLSQILSEYIFICL